MISPDDLSRTAWHSLKPEQALERLQVSAEEGLSEEEVERRLATFGNNTLRKATRRGPLMRFLLQFHQALVYILLGAAAAAGVLGEVIDAAVIFGVVMINSIIGFVQESRALGTLDALQKSITTEVSAVRGGRRQKVPSRDLVPGDIVRLASGDKVPADMRLVEVRDLQVDESTLTGESVASEKELGVLDEETGLADRLNCVYSGTLVTYGRASGVVFATGDRTAVGKISEMMTAADVLETPLTRKISHFSHILLWAILGLALSSFLLGWMRGQPLMDNFMAAIALAVAAIPEGLPAVVTITLAIGVSRMAKRQAIIRKLPAVETLGSTSVICSDKTGTLTENQMTVQSIYAGGEAFDVSGAGYAPEGRIERKGEPLADDQLTPALRRVLAGGALCSDANIVKKEGAWQVDGSPTEGAMLTSAMKAGLKRDELAKQFPRINVLPFESQHKYMATLHDDPESKRRIVFLKGAVEVILDRCSAMMDAEGGRIPLDRKKLNHELDLMAGKGQRVLAVASVDFPDERDEVRHEDLEKDMLLLGIQGMIDPPREAAIEAVKKCQEAGITVKMITGDHATTALAIARQIGIAETGDGDGAKAAYTGKELEKMSDEELIGVAASAAVFARVTPEHKLRLVRALQAKEHIVAMTGDGVNDAPALRQANIGVAMGITGTEVSKEASDMVLTDDNFASIQAAVEEGRGVFDNLTKFITYILPTNFGQGLVILAAMIAAITLPVSPVQALWINMATAVFLGLTLAFEPNESGLMQRAPRNPSAPLLNNALLLRMGLVTIMMLAGAFGLFVYETEVREADLAEARTSTVNVIMIIQTFYLINCRSLTHSLFSVGLFSNRWIWVGVTAMFLFQLLFTYAPFMHTMFDTAPTDLFSWLIAFGAGAATSLVISAEKFIQGRIARRKASGLS